MIQIRTIFLVWLVSAYVVATATAEEGTNSTEGEMMDVFTCISICGDGDEDGKALLKTPDLVVEYNWNLRVPTCAGKSCESATCSVLERKLPAFDEDEFSCKKHQIGLKEVGCECSGRSSMASSRGWVIAATIAFAATSALL